MSTYQSMQKFALIFEKVESSLNSIVGLSWGVGGAECKYNETSLRPMNTGSIIVYTMSKRPL